MFERGRVTASVILVALTIRCLSWHGIYLISSPDLTDDSNFLDLWRVILITGCDDATVSSIQRRSLLPDSKGLGKKAKTSVPPLATFYSVNRAVHPSSSLLQARRTRYRSLCRKAVCKCLMIPAERLGSGLHNQQDDGDNLCHNHIDLHSHEAFVLQLYFKRSTSAYQDDSLYLNCPASATITSERSKLYKKETMVGSPTWEASS